MFPKSSASSCSSEIIFILTARAKSWDWWHGGERTSARWRRPRMSQNGKEQVMLFQDVVGRGGACRRRRVGRRLFARRGLRPCVPARSPASDLGVCPLWRQRLSTSSLSVRIRTGSLTLPLFQWEVISQDEMRYEVRVVGKLEQHPSHLFLPECSRLLGW